MDVRTLIQQYRANNPEGKFFNREILRDYGESINRMRVTGKGVIRTREGYNIIAYELVAVQVNPWFGTREKRYYFDEDTFEVVCPADGQTTTEWKKRA